MEYQAREFHGVAGKCEHPQAAHVIWCEDVELPMLTLFQYNLSEDYIAALGHEVGRADGYFFFKDGAPCLCSELDTVVVKLNFDFAPELEAQMAEKEGCNYSLLCVFTRGVAGRVAPAAHRGLQAPADGHCHPSAGACVVAGRVALLDAV